MVPKNQKIINPKAQRFSRMLVGISVLQIVYGGFMSGLRAATHYPTFPDMNGELVPSSLFSMSPLWLNFFENVTTIQFVHRSIAYVLAALIVYFWYKNTQLSTNNKYFKPALHFLLGVLVVQVSLGITVLLLSANGTIPVGFGVAHQAGGLLLLSTLLFLTFQFQSKSFKA